MHTDHAVALGDRRADEAVVAQVDVGDGRNSSPDVEFELRSGLDVGEISTLDRVLNVGLDAVGLPGRGVGVEVATELQLDRAGVDEVVDESRKPLGHGVEPAGKQDVEVMTLRDGAAGRSRRRFVVAIEDDHFVEVVREDARREQPAHPAADDDRPISESSTLCHLAPPCVGQCSDTTVAAALRWRKRRRSRRSRHLRSGSGAE